jgi:2-polyprenyl-3-methyl-5-hydroxy-6-metoxy-1,4-benzoquinol methylase
MNESSYPSCLICGSGVLWSEDRELCRCQSCGVIRTRYDYNPRLYRTTYAKNYIEYAKTDVNTPLNLFRLGLVSRWLKESQVIMDIGCCVGEFLRFAEEYYQCFGFEPNPEAALLARKRCKSKIFGSFSKTFLKKIPEAHCITMFDVVEHLENPITAVSDLITNHLLPGGVLVITTPNVEVASNSDSLRTWKHWKPQEHLWLHTEYSLTKLLDKVNLDVVHVGREESDIRPGNPEGDIITIVGRKPHA